MSNEKLNQPNGQASKFSVEYAMAKAKETGMPLPPGELVNLNQIEWTNRRFLLEQAKLTGPIFKALNWGELWICIVGLRECQKFILENDEHLTPQTLDLEPFFPKGFLRQMKGDTHMAYRRALVRAISPEVMSANASIHLSTVREALKSFSEIQEPTKRPRDAFIKTLSQITSGLLIQIFFGARLGSDTFQKLMKLYKKLGPDGLVWQLGEQQKEAFAEIRDFLLKQIETSSGKKEWLPESIIERMSADGAIDDTMLGNLIYMVEMGRYDMYSLFRWIAKFAADHPEWMNKIASDGNSLGESGKTLTEAFVLETLRLEQIERLLRTVEKDIEFGGYLIPKHSTIRLCLWESHKLPTSFPAPFDFNPERFLGSKFIPDQYAPFGLGNHQCPFADVAIRMSILFLQTLAENYILEPVNDGPPIRGIYHWEPAYQFSVRLTEKAL
jgi:cytochrome P450